MPKKMHLVAGIVATLTIAIFFLSTVLVELFGSHEAVATVKQLIVLPGLFILVPAIAATGGSGFYASKSRKGNGTYFSHWHRSGASKRLKRKEKAGFGWVRWSLPHGHPTHTRGQPCLIVVVPLIVNNSAFGCGDASIRARRWISSTC